MALPIGLLDSVKNYLDITWVDLETDNKVIGIIGRGIKYLDGINGKENDYITEDNARELLFDYCRYARSGMLDEFRKNYLDALLSFQIKQEVATYEAENPSI